MKHKQTFLVDVGDSVWANYRRGLKDSSGNPLSPEILEYKVTNYSLSKNKSGFVSKNYRAYSPVFKGLFISFSDSDIGVTVFTNCEDCEASFN